MDGNFGISFEEYFQKYYQKVFGYVFKKVANYSVAEDITMEVFLSCYKNFDSFDPQKASFQTWLYVIVNNKLKNYYRDKKEYDDIDECMEYVGSFEDDIIAAENLKNMRDTLAKALNTLSESQKSIIIMKYFKNMQALEIGEKLGLSSGNVRVQLSRALNKLRDYFKKQGIEWES